MKLILFVLLLLQSTGEQQWIKIGEAEISTGYMTPYRINLLTPHGVHDTEDIKNAVQAVQFDLEWLAPVTTEEQVAKHFKKLIEGKLGSAESIKFNASLINRLTRKLPEAKRFDRWQFIFSPDEGTHVLIGGQRIHTIIGSEINRALYQAWLFRDPVTTSKLLTRLLKLGK